MDKIEKGINWFTLRMGRLFVITLAIGAIFGVIGRCQTTNHVPKAAQTMARNGAATPKNLALLDGEKPTTKVIQAYEDVLLDLKQKCQEPQHELIYMASSLSRRYKNAKLNVNNYDAMIRLHVMAKSRGKSTPVNCTNIYSTEINKSNSKLR